MTDGWDVLATDGEFNSDAKVFLMSETNDDVPLLTGKLTRLRALERNDLPLTQAWHNDPRLAIVDANHFPGSMAKEERWFEEMSNNPSRNVLVIELIADQSPVGLLYFDTDYVHRSANISINVVPEYQRRGLGGDALMAAVHHAFARIGLNRLSATIFMNNQKSIALFEKCGFRKEGVLRQAYIWLGIPQDRVVMGILRDEYYAGC